MVKREMGFHAMSFKLIPTSIIIIMSFARRVDNIDSCEIPKLESMIKRLGYSKVRHSLEFFGVCEDCSKKPA
jgi:Fe2+ or Zn2+ uptake regulation protein